MTNPLADVVKELETALEDIEESAMTPALPKRPDIAACARDAIARLQELQRQQDVPRCPHGRVANMGCRECGPSTTNTAVTPSGVESGSGHPSAEWIDQNSVQCDARQHVFVDLTSLSGEDRTQHAVAGDPEGAGSGCAYCKELDLEREAQAAQPSPDTSDTALLDFALTKLFIQDAVHGGKWQRVYTTREELRAAMRAEKEQG